MSLPVRPQAAIAVSSLTGVETERYLRLVRDTLKRLDAKSGEIPKASIKHSAVASDNLMVKVSTEIDPSEGARIRFRVAPRPNVGALSIDKCIEILSDIVLQTLQMVDAHHVEWLDPRTRLSPEEFQQSRSYISPKRARREMMEAPITERSLDELEESLSRMFEQNPPVTEPGHGRERAAKVEENRRRARETLEHRRNGPVPLILEGTDGPYETTPRDAIHNGKVRPRRSLLSFLPNVLSALHARTFLHAAALGGTGLVFWRAGMFDPILKIVGS